MDFLLWFISVYFLIIGRYESALIMGALGMVLGATNPKKRSDAIKGLILSAMGFLFRKKLLPKFLLKILWAPVRLFQELRHQIYYAGESPSKIIYHTCIDANSDVHFMISDNKEGLEFGVEVERIMDIAKLDRCCIIHFKTSADIDNLISRLEVTKGIFNRPKEDRAK